MKVIKKIFYVLISAFLVCTMISCETEETKGLLDAILTAEEQQSYNEFVDGVVFTSIPWASNIHYRDVRDGVDKLSAIDLKGIPVLICKSIENERGQSTEESRKNNVAVGIELSEFRTYTVSYSLRVDYYDFVSVYKNGVIRPSDNYYAYWKYAKDELPKIAGSDIETEEKIKQFIKFGYFAIPYVKEELEKGNTEYEKFFPLIGAHLTTADYMKVINSTDAMTPAPTEEEIEKSLLESGADFDYKKWLNENEEDLNNLFKFLDEYIKDYESKTEE
ncbi:MAG: hypothetical protein UIG59_07430 [Acutalibacteraceae bacterium]|nr:hypothetical protein [Acutalibacteraceae bacterium]